jgi:2-polyprenyl-3-methyl-5-hydroxy-6-metoxy-1,4-benzoquinol methylase
MSRPPQSDPLHGFLGAGYDAEVIGRRELPSNYQEFLKKWGAPNGHVEPTRRVIHSLAKRLRLPVVQARAIGPFGFQSGNNATRRFEYPWAFYAVPVSSDHTVIDLGGSLGGLQFVLAKQGARVINVDPSETATMGWAVDHKTIALLNRAFGTSVELRRRFLQDASIEEDSVDRIYCISTIEHIPQDELPELAATIGRILKPGGFAVLTVDLFFDLAPFTDRISNYHGTNVNIRWLIEKTGLKLFRGETSELFGYPEFDSSSILSRAMEFTQGNVALNVAQAVVLQKPT